LKTYEKAITEARPAPVRNTDITRAHAINWALGVATLVFCLLVLAFVLAKALLHTSIPSEALWLILVSPILGLSMGAYKLVVFTEEHRWFLYHIEEAMGVDLDNDGSIGQPRAQTEPEPGTFLMGVDGVRHRLNTELTAGEIATLKAYLLSNEKASVRGLTGLVGDRASLLRDELVTMGVCVEPPRKNQAAGLSDAGKKAVRRW
jgi:hypothetical protein